MHHTHLQQDSMRFALGRREPSEKLEGTRLGQHALKKVTYTHDAMIDLILVNPALSLKEIAATFGYTPLWVSRIFGSDAFQSRLAVRKADLVDPTMVLSIEERLKGVAMRSLDLVLEKLETPEKVSIEQAMKAVDMSTKALGYGARQQTTNVQTNFVVALPSQVENAVDWAEQHAPHRNIPRSGIGKIPDIESPELAALVEVRDE